MSSNELLHIITPFLTRFPELFRWFKEYTGHADGPPVHISSSGNSPTLSCDSMLNNINRTDRNTGEQSEVGESNCSTVESQCLLNKVKISLFMKIYIQNSAFNNPAVQILSETRLLPPLNKFSQYPSVHFRPSLQTAVFLF